MHLCAMKAEIVTMPDSVTLTVSVGTVALRVGRKNSIYGLNVHAVIRVHMLWLFISHLKYYKRYAGAGDM